MNPRKLTIAGLFVILISAVARAQASGNIGIDGQFSSMSIEKGSGDFVGYDIRVIRTGDAYHLVLFCSEGGLIGPVKEDLYLDRNIVILHPRNDGCGKRIELQFTPKGILITTEFISRELIPRHRNYLKEERWK